MLMGSIRIEFTDDFEAVSSETWDQLLAASPTRTIFQAKAWQQPWWETFGRGKLMLICVYESDQIVAIAPFFADQGMVFFVGSGGSDYLDFIGSAFQAEILASVLDCARAQVSDFVGFRFYHVPDASPTGALLSSVAFELGLSCYDEGWLDAPLLRFEDWPTAKRLPAEKKSLLRHEAALKKIGRLQIDHFLEPAQIAPLLSTFFEQHEERWEATPFPSLFLDKKQREFYHKLCESLGASQWIRFTQVTLDHLPIAFHFGFLFQNSFLWYKPSFNIKLAHRSPGEVLLRSLLLRARHEGVQVFDFGLGDETFKQRFSTETNKVRTWGLYPTTTNR